MANVNGYLFENFRRDIQFEKVYFLVPSLKIISDDNCGEQALFCFEEQHWLHDDNINNVDESLPIHTASEKSVFFTTGVR